MPRKPRELIAGGLYHVYARGNDRGVIFRDDADRRAYLSLLAQVIGRHDWRCLTYCLMDNHIHLLLETPQPDLATGMHWFHGSYARRFNRRHRRTGHVFEGRYGAVRVEDDAQLWMVVGYIVRNPVEARACREPEDWSWCAHAATIEGRTPAWLDADRLFAYLAAIAGGEGSDRYAELTRTRPGRVAA